MTMLLLDTGVSFPIAFSKRAFSEKIGVSPLPEWHRLRVLDYSNQSAIAQGHHRRTLPRSEAGDA